MHNIGNSHSYHAPADGLHVLHFSSTLFLVHLIKVMLALDPLSELCMHFFALIDS